jgi:hypothetical protein
LSELQKSALTATPTLPTVWHRTEQIVLEAVFGAFVPLLYDGSHYQRELESTLLAVRSCRFQFVQSI